MLKVVSSAIHKTSLCILLIVRPDSIDLLVLGHSCIVIIKTKLENLRSQNKFRKSEKPKNIIFNVIQILSVFPFISISYLSAFRNWSGKDPRNKKSIKSGLILKSVGTLGTCLVMNEI